MINKEYCKNINFVCVFLILLGTFINSSIYLVTSGIVSLINYSIFLMGILMIVINFNKDNLETIFNKKINILSLIFLLLFMTTILINDKKIDNAKYFVFTIIQCIVLFNYYNFEKEYFNKIIKMILFLISIVNIVSFVLILMNIQFSFHGNINCGMYSGPNIASAIVAISTCLFLIFYNKDNIAQSIFTIINIIINIYLIKNFSSRAGLLLFLIFIFCYFFFIISLFTKSIIKGFLIGIVIMTFSYGFSNILYSGVNKCKDFVISSISFTENSSNDLTEEIIPDNSNLNENIEIEITDQTEEVSIDKAEVGRTDENIQASNFYRLNLIKYGIIAGMEKPLLGVGVCNVADVISEISPVELIGVEGGGTHNSYVQVFISNGITGLIVFLGIIINILCHSFINIYFKCLNTYDLDNKIVYFGFLSLTISMLIYGLFEANLILSASFIAAIFWLILGTVKFYE